MRNVIIKKLRKIMSIWSYFEYSKYMKDLLIMTVQNSPKIMFCRIVIIKCLLQCVCVHAVNVCVWVCICKCVLVEVRGLYWLSSSIVFYFIF